MYSDIFKVFSFDFLSKTFLGILSLVLIRFMAPGEYAKYTFAVAIATVLMQVISGAFNRVYIVSSKTLEIKEREASILVLQIIVIFLIAILAFFLTSFAFLLYCGLVAYAIGNTSLDYLKTIYQKELKFTRFSLIELLRALSCLTIVLLILRLKRSEITAIQTIWILAITTLAAFALIAPQILKLNTNFLRTLEIGKKILSGRYVNLFVYFIIISIFGQLDIFMLKKMSDEITLASYGSAARYYGIIMLSLTAVHSVLLPYIEKAPDAKALYNIVRNVNNFMLFLAPIILIAIFCAGWLIPFIDNGKYPQAIPAFRILAVSSLISFTLSPYVNIVMKFEEFKWLCVTAGIFLLIAVLLNALLIPPLKASGTALATLISFGGFNLMTMLKARKLTANYIAKRE
jgi:O-antigen/teichoic acid export membrane protein